MEDDGRWDVTVVSTLDLFGAQRCFTVPSTESPDLAASLVPESVPRGCCGWPPGGSPDLSASPNVELKDEKNVSADRNKM